MAKPNLPTPRVVSYSPNTEVLATAREALAAAEAEREVAGAAREATILACEVPATAEQDAADNAAFKVVSLAEAKVAVRQANVERLQKVQAESDPEYRLRTPNAETMSEAKYLTDASGLVGSSNEELLDAMDIARLDGRLEGAAELLAAAREQLNAEGFIEDATWSRVYRLARTVPGEAGDGGPADLIALRHRRAEHMGLAKVRVHLLMDGKRNPLTLSDLADISGFHLGLISAKIDELSVITPATKND